MNDLKHISNSYAEMWERARLLIGSYFEYLEQSLSADADAEPLPPPIPSIRDFNALITCLKRTMDAHHAALTFSRTNEHDTEGNGGDSESLNAEILGLLERYREHDDEEAAD